MVEFDLFKSYDDEDDFSTDDDSEDSD